MSYLVERTRANADAIAATDGKKIGAYQSDLICKETMEIVKNLRDAATAIETLTREKSALEQHLSQAGDNIELAEAEQRGFERGKKSAESALREALDVVRPFAKVAPLIEYLDNIEYITLGASKLLNAGMIRAARAFIEKHAPAAPSEDK